jgi:hypothetical protein
MNSDEYVSQVLDFRLHLDNMDITAGSNEQHITAFYESDWEIKINGKSVTISNEADFFYRMVDLFDKYIALSL